MSSTNRGGKRSPADFYATPAWCVRRLLERVDLPPGRWLEPAAGDGAIMLAAEEMRGERALRGWHSADCWDAFEIRKECGRILRPIVQDCGLCTPERRASKTGLFTDGQVVIGDFLDEMLLRAHVRQNGYAVTLGNPPFSQAMPFLRACMSISDHVIFLLRLGFLGSEERSDFIRKTRPDIHILPNRPAFTPNKHGKLSTDSIEYAWFHWHEKSTGAYQILASTSKEERNGDRKHYEARLRALGFDAGSSGGREEDGEAEEAREDEEREIDLGFGDHQR